MVDVGDRDPIGDGSFRFSLRIGVTGHRDPTDPEALEGPTMAAVRKLLDALEGVLGTTKSGRATSWLGVKMISALAEGGDRIVARATLAAAANAGWQAELLAVFPYKFGYYRKYDCTDDDSREKFDKLLQFPNTIKMELQKDVPDDDRERDRWYGEVGEYVADQCDVLVAVWDNTDNHKPAGTAATVNYALRQGTPILWIPTTRLMGTADAGAVALEQPELILRPDQRRDASERRYPLAGLSSEVLCDILVRFFVDVRRRSNFIERLMRVEEINRHMHEPSVRASIEKECASEADVAGVEYGSMIHEVNAWIVPKYVAADSLATRYRRRFTALDYIVYGGSVTAVTLGAFALLFPHRIWGLDAAEVGVLAVLLVFLFRSTRQNLYNGWVSFRAMAEYFRSGRFVYFAAPNPGDFEFGRLLQFQGTRSKRRIIPWFAPIVEDVWAQRPPHRITDADLEPVKSFLQEKWIDHQRDYHDARSRDHALAHQRNQFAVRGIFIATAVIAAAHAILSAVAGLSEVETGAFSVFAIFLASVGAAWNSLAGRAGHKATSERFSQVADHLDRYGNRLHDMATFDELRSHVVVIRRTMLGEATEWFEGMANSEVETPT